MRVEICKHAGYFEPDQTEAVICSGTDERNHRDAELLGKVCRALRPPLNNLGREQLVSMRPGPCGSGSLRN